MPNDINGVSIEALAAFIDGNLAESDFLHVEQAIKADNAFDYILDASDAVDSYIVQMEEEGFELPAELLDSNLPIPHISDEVWITDDTDEVLVAVADDPEPAADNHQEPEDLYDSDIFDDPQSISQADDYYTPADDFDLG